MDKELIFGLSNVLFNILNPLIGLLGLFEMGLMIISLIKLAKLKLQIDKLNKPDNKKLVDVQKQSKTVKRSFSIENRFDWNEFDEFSNRFQLDMRWYSAFAMIIQLFTLLGILGTVCGLFIALKNWDDLSNSKALIDGVKFALSSTILGIILAIFFKICDTAICSLFVNYIQDGIILFKNNYNEEKIAE